MWKRSSSVRSLSMRERRSRLAIRWRRGRMSVSPKLTMRSMRLTLLSCQGECFPPARQSLSTEPKNRITEEPMNALLPFHLAQRRVQRAVAVHPHHKILIGRCPRSVQINFPSAGPAFYFVAAFHRRLSEIEQNRWISAWTQIGPLYFSATPCQTCFRRPARGHSFGRRPAVPQSFPLHARVNRGESLRGIRFHLAPRVFARPVAAQDFYPLTGALVEPAWLDGRRSCQQHGGKPTDGWRSHSGSTCVSGNEIREKVPTRPGEPRARPSKIGAAMSAVLPLTEITDLRDPSLYLNRELSHLEFQRRVLEEARDARNPLLERVKFLAILGSNIDEFFMVRVAGLMQQIENKVQDPGIDGHGPAEVLESIRVEVDRLMNEAYAFYREELVPALAAANIRIMELSELTSEQRSQLDNLFLEKVFPVLTPLAFDQGRPFPHISNLSFNVAVVVRDPDGPEHFARVKIPDTLPQFLPVCVPGDNASGHFCFVLIEQLVMANLQHLFPGLEIVGAHVFHVTRDADFAIKELETDDLLESIEEAVWQRRFRDAVRLQVDFDMPDSMMDILASNLEVEAASVYRVDGPLDLSRMRHLAGLDRPDLKDKPFLPATPPGFGTKEDDVFGLIRHQSQLLHHPYDSFQPVIEFLRKAAKDPEVLAIKMTLYRLGRNSPIVEALLEAVEHGKQVAVLVELKARFDEESNIEWARALEREGVHVVYGLMGLKVHSKVALVVRREGDQIRRYCHLATGNYNSFTARLYTDLGLFTADNQIGADVTDLFNYLTGYSHKKTFRKLLVAPLNMRQRMEEMIQREIDVHRNGGQGRLIFKTNALEDASIIRLLYQASQAGVDVDLIVRGACCLRPGIPGVSDNIRVCSIVGRFLEHSRIYYFGNNGADECYIGSADLMPRNLNRRVEVLFPVERPHLVLRLKFEILRSYLNDQRNVRRMHSDGSYGHKSDDGGHDSKSWFLNQRAQRPPVLVG